MDEVAEWRKKYDEEVENSNESMQKLIEVTQTLEKQINGWRIYLETRLNELQKENHGMFKDTTKMKLAVEYQKFKCKKTGIKEV